MTAIAPTFQLDQSGLADLQTISSRQAGRGEAFRRILERSGLTQAKLAQELGFGRSTISNWVKETRWPPDPEMRLALATMGVDRKQIVDHWGSALSTDSEAIDLAVNLKMYLDCEADPLERKLIIGRTLEEEVFIRQGFRGREDTRAAEFFMNRLDRYEELKRKQNVSTQRNVTPEQGQWAAGAGVYANQPEATTDVGFSDDAEDVPWL